MTVQRLRQRGFTLLEMLVVLALMALATGIVLPQAAGWMDSVQERGWRADLRAYLQGMPVRAFLLGRSISVDAAALKAAVPNGPAGLDLHMAEPLVYGATGVALGGRLQLVRGNVREVWEIRPVSGQVLEGS